MLPKVFLIWDLTVAIFHTIGKLQFQTELQPELVCAVPVWLTSYAMIMTEEHAGKASGFRLI